MSDAREPVSGPIHEPLVVPESLAGERVDRAVALLTGWSRAAVKILVEAGDVYVDGRVASRSAKLVPGTTLEWRAEPAPPAPPGPEPDIEIDVVYSDDDVIVVDKAAGLVVHPGAGHPDGTLVNALLARFDLAGVGDPARPGIVHRLDRETSGLLVVARTPHAYETLVAALSERTVARHYIAVVRGNPSSTRGTVDAPIGRSTRMPTKMAVRAGGKDARTHYEVTAVYDDAAKLAVTLETGRTHQIRVHLAAIDHPVLGDSVYGTRDPVVSRPFLHAAELAFTHPATGAEMRFQSVLPPELEVALASLGVPS